MNRSQLLQEKRGVDVGGWPWRKSIFYTPGVLPLSPPGNLSTWFSFLEYFLLFFPPKTVSRLPSSVLGLYVIVCVWGNMLIERHLQSTRLPAASSHLSKGLHLHRLPTPSPCYFWFSARTLSKRLLFIYWRKTIFYDKVATDCLSGQRPRENCVPLSNARAPSRSQPNDAWPKSGTKFAWWILESDTPDKAGSIIDNEAYELLASTWSEAILRPWNSKVSLLGLLVSW